MYVTVPMVEPKVDALEILSFNEQSTFDTSALFGWINRNLFPHMKQKYQKWIIHQKLRVPTSEGSVQFLIPS